jgi:hypothetical protein
MWDASIRLGGWSAAVLHQLCTFCVFYKHCTHTVGQWHSCGTAAPLERVTGELQQQRLPVCGICQLAVAMSGDTRLVPVFCTAVFHDCNNLYCCWSTVSLSAATCTDVGIHAFAVATAACIYAALVHLMQVTPHSRCKASITIQSKRATGGDEFFVTGAAVVPFSKAVPSNVVDKLEVTAGRALGRQLPFSWP